LRLFPLLAATAAVTATSIAFAQQKNAPAQNAAQPSSPAKGSKPWVPPGTPGSPIDGQLFHAQVLLDAAGFSPGAIDGRNGTSFKLAVKGFQQANGLQLNGKLDAPTRQALLKASKPSTVMVKLGPDDVRSTYIYPLPKDPEQQYKLPFLGYRNMLEKVAERYHTTPDTVVALNGPDKLIGLGKTLRLPNVVPASRDYSGSEPKGAQLMNLLNVDARQPHGSYIVVDKSDGVLRVIDGPVPAGPYSTEADAKSGKAATNERTQGTGSAPAGRVVAQFPVTIGSTHDPLPIGKWKVPTFSFLPPFHYQPNLFWDAKDTSQEHMLPPGPNGPVGVAWLDLTKEHYGIHGTPEPSTIGKSESHGCIRMTNWDVVRLARIMGKPGFTAIFQQ
jgi:L,D-transpeptidase catalytic domain/Putative peptidoglycan binding domain